MKSKLVLGAVLFLIGCIAPTICIVKRIQFNQQCSGYLKQAADAITVETALERVNLALDYMEAHSLTDGYTSVIYKTEDENIGFWYNNIKSCRSDLEGCIGGSQLEKTNTLMKLRETLTDNGESGIVLTIPEGIWKFPYNTLWAILNVISVLLMCPLVWWLIVAFA